MSFNRKPLVVCCSLLFAAAGSARADQMSETQSKLEALQKQIQELQSQMGAMKHEQEEHARAAPPPASAVAMKPGTSPDDEGTGVSSIWIVLPSVQPPCVQRTRRIL